jgi:tetratricopeptide (TPR) repeat protein
LSATISVNLGTVLHMQGQTEEALSRYREALAFYERIGAKRGIALACTNLGDLYWLDGEGDWTAANEQWQRAQRLYDEIGDQHGLALVLSNLGDGHVKLGYLDTAEPLLRRARALAVQIDDDEMRGEIDRGLARLWGARQLAA